MRRASVPALVLLASLLLTGVATAFVTLTSRARDEARFSNAVQATEDRIGARLEAYTALLRGAAGLFAASSEVDARDFHAYVSRLELQQRYPGVQGIGFTRLVRPGEAEALVARRRAEGVPDFRLWPEAPRSEAYAIVYLEPLDRRNLAALGFDMFSEPTRREAMERARDTGAPALSGKVTLVQEIEVRKQAGFLLYVPVYRGGGTPETVAERRELLEGFVYSPFRAEDLFSGIFGTEREPRVSFQVYDGLRAAPEHLLYDSRWGVAARGHASAFLQRAVVEVAGRPWTLEFQSRPSFEWTSRSSLPVAIAGMGMLVSLALYAVTRAQAQARQRAERAVGLRDEFLSVAGHELRTPLTSLSLKLGGMAHAAETAEGPLAQRVARDVLVAQRQVRKLADLISQLLDVSRLSRQGLALERAEMELSALVAEVVAVVAPLAERAGCQVELEVEGPVVGRWDRQRLEQVVTNLLTNALKYGAGRPVHVRLARQGRWAQLEVVDEGIGIAPEALGRIFGRFERAVSERHYGGLGLGLYISQRIVEAHGGTIRVQSELGHGATFVVELPTEG